jgi:hypothetical protein
MAYIESFLLYWVLVVIGGVFFTLFVLMVFGGISIGAKILKKNKPSFLELSSMKKNLKRIAIVYLIIFSVFYIQRAMTYFSGERAYKEAKAYAIVGEYVFLAKAGLLQFVYPDHVILKPLNEIEGYILSKINNYIPKEDGERQIWNYKFHLIDYARTMFAPRTEDTIKRDLSFTNPAASMTPELLTILDEIYNSMDTLNKSSMKDKEFSEIDRYLVIASMGPYYEQYFPYYGGLSSDLTDPRDFPKKLTAFWDNQTFTNQYKNYLNVIDNIDVALNKDKNLAIAFEEHPRIKASYYWSGVRGYIAYFNKETYRGKYPCTNPNFLKYVKYYKEYVDWAYMTPRSSFKSLSRREKKTYDFMIEAENSSYYIAKYICSIPFKYMTREEASIGNFDNFARLYINRANIKHIKEIEKSNKGE